MCNWTMLTTEAGASVNTLLRLTAFISTLQQSSDSDLGKQREGGPRETRPQCLKGCAVPHSTGKIQCRIQR